MAEGACMAEEIIEITIGPDGKTEMRVNGIATRRSA
jgi:hypothetical protein